MRSEEDLVKRQKIRSVAAKPREAIQVGAGHCSVPPRSWRGQVKWRSFPRKVPRGAGNSAPATDRNTRCHLLGIEN